MKKNNGSVLKRAMKSMVAMALLLLSAHTVWAQGAAAAPVASPILLVKDSAWARLLPNGIAAGYLTLQNSGSEAVRLIMIASPKTYGHVALHESVLEDGVNHMRAIKTLSIPAHSDVALAPGGYHLMLLKPLRAIQPGDAIPVVLTFSNGQVLKVMLTARTVTGAH